MPNLSQVKTTLGAFGESTFSSGIASRFGQQVVLDFYTYMALIGAAYQVKAGTINTPRTGTVGIVDTQAEMCADAASGTTIIPVSLQVSIQLTITGTAHTYAAKSVATVSSAGTAFVPLPLRSNGVAAVSTARVQQTGAVTVTAELATTTLRHWEFANALAEGAGSDLGLSAVASGLWNPRVPPVLVGPRCFFVQIAAASNAPQYFAHFDYLEAPTSVLT